MPLYHKLIHNTLVNHINDNTDCIIIYTIKISTWYEQHLIMVFYKNIQLLINILIK